MKLKLAILNILLLIFYFLMCLAAPAAYAEPPALNVGVIEARTAPDNDHIGIYPYVGLSTVFQDGIAIVPELVIEYSPDAERWGFVGSITLDYTLNRDIGLDWLLLLLHDQAGLDFNNALFLGGLGVGTSFFYDVWTISPFVAGYLGLNEPGWSWSAGLNVGYTL